MCSFMLMCQCCFAIVKVLLKKVTYFCVYCMLRLISTLTIIDAHAFKRFIVSKCSLHLASERYYARR